jgi:hypothetical protein
MTPDEFQGFLFFGEHCHSMALAFQDTFDHDGSVQDVIEH